MSGGFPVEIIVLLVLVAGFLILRLRSVLGKRVGYERKEQPDQRRAGMQGPTIDGVAEPLRPRPGRPIPPPHTPAGQTLERIAEIDKNFDPVRFVDGAEEAFRRIVAAFAEGDLATLKTLLTPSVYTTFEQAVAARKEAGETQHSEIRSIEEAAIEEADLMGDQAAIVIRFVSTQINFTRDRDGQVIAGAEEETEIVDIWSFERKLRSRDPTWRLASARSS